MRTILTSAFLCLALAACGDKSKPAPSTPTPTAPADDKAAACNLEGENGTPATMEQCQCMGYEAVGDIGNGQVACPDGSTEISKIRYGIEGGVCCVQGETAPTAG